MVSNMEEKRERERWEKGCKHDDSVDTIAREDGREDKRRAVVKAAAKEPGGTPDVADGHLHEVGFWAL